MLSVQEDIEKSQCFPHFIFDYFILNTIGKLYKLFGNNFFRNRFYNFNKNGTTLKNNKL